MCEGTCPAKECSLQWHSSLHCKEGIRWSKHNADMCKCYRDATQRALLACWLHTYAFGGLAPPPRCGLVRFAPAALAPPCPSTPLSVETGPLLIGEKGELLGERGERGESLALLAGRSSTLLIRATNSLTARCPMRPNSVTWDTSVAMPDAPVQLGGSSASPSSPSPSHSPSPASSPTSPSPLSRPPLTYASRTLRLKSSLLLPSYVVSSRSSLSPGDMLLLRLPLVGEIPNTPADAGFFWKYELFPSKPPRLPIVNTLPSLFPFLSVCDCPCCCAGWCLHGGVANT